MKPIQYNTMKLSLLCALLPVFAHAAKPANFNVPNNAICINQADVNQGTLIIDTPGTYKLCEHITFHPNGPAPGELPTEDAFDPDYNTFTEHEFGLGFFAGIAIAADDVTIHLNGFTIEQSAGHALMQRFFAIFELASSPFIPNVGPAQFVGGDASNYVPAKNVEILGPGVIGRSSHHGIHGNDNENVKIAEVVFRDFEVAAVALNNVDGLEISGCTIVQNRQDVPVVGLFSAARFLRPYGKYLKSIGYRMKLYNEIRGQNEWRTAEDVYDKMITSINNVYEDVVLSGLGKINATAHPEEHHLFDNPFSVVDGPCYGFLVHGKGPAVGGQGEDFNDENPAVTSSNVVIIDNNINNLKCWNNEVPALFGSCGGHGCAVNDPRGAIFQTVKTFATDNPYLAMDANGRYQGNVVADMQMMVAKAIHDSKLQNLPTRQIGPNSIEPELVHWAQSGSQMLLPQYVCNGDSMHHVVKGIIAIRVEDTAGFSIESNSINNIENVSVEPFTNCAAYHIGASAENLQEQQAGNVRAISVSAVRGYSNGDSEIKSNEIQDVSSENANVIIGIDVQGDSSDVNVEGNTVDLHRTIREDTSDQYIALRVREVADSSVSVGKNKFSEETQILNGSSRRQRLLRGRYLVNPHTTVAGMPFFKHVSGDIEWKFGGCPFNDDYYKEPGHNNAFKGGVEVTDNKKRG
jgi:hypothetical protein